MPEKYIKQKVSYDKDGNIILISHTPKKEEQPPAPKFVTVKRNPKLLKGIATETHKQYQASLKDLSLGKSFIDRIWEFLTQPVWVLRPKSRPKKSNRIILFFSDILRFGTTFAVLFVGLFGALNYQSYTQIVKSHLNPLQTRHNEIQSKTATTLINNNQPTSIKFLRSNHKPGQLLAYLPQVGPPERRLLVPKLGLNVPISTPPLRSLLNEDWDKLEEDIQDSLQYGVVHYPGTAKPGQAGNFFLTGHSSYYPWKPGNFKTVFAQLGELEVGDEYIVYYNGDTHRYVINEKKEVMPTDVSVLDQPTTKRISTLMTCTPIGTTLKRLIIKSQEVDPETGIPLEGGAYKQIEYPEVKARALPI